MLGNSIGTGVTAAGVGASAPPDERQRSTSRQRQWWEGAALGAALLGLMLTGCSDARTPSEATPDAAAAQVQEDVDAAATASTGRRKISVLDDCDPSDPAWASVGGCTLAGGLVTFAQFLEDLPRGHPAWRNEPSYLKVRVNKAVKVVNEGGREHTFTPVAEYGGGVVPLLNLPGEAVAPECADEETFNSSFLPPGAEIQVGGFHSGAHRFQCCIHPWMRAEIRVP